jgi:hypothetical protein
MSSPFGVGGSTFRTVKDRAMAVDTVAFPAYSRHVLTAAGAFDEELVRNQDDEYNYRLRQMGFKIYLMPDIHSKYYSRSTIGSLWRQYFQYGYWKVRVMQKHPRQMRWRQFAPPTFVLSLISAALLAIFFPVGRIFFLAVIGTYLAANLAASVCTSRRQNRVLIPLLPVMFAVLHLGYGIGFLAGLVKFRSHWQFH